MLGVPSHLRFWHEIPEVNAEALYDRLGPYYLTHRKKADYPGPFDESGVPLLNYRGKIGLQHNPIAIAQYGLAQFNRSRNGREPQAREKFLRAADWLLNHLERNSHGVPVWQHHFPWAYRAGLQPPWASALAQGQSISVLLRASAETGRADYLDAARQAFAAFTRTVEEGGVTVRDKGGELWLEEYLVQPPSHILNGAISAGWGLFDTWLATQDSSAKRLFDESARTLAAHLARYDTGFWSLYELPGNGLPRMMASFFYHRLHIAQLKVLARMTGNDLFEQAARRWASYQARPIYRARALAEKIAFKLRYY